MALKYSGVASGTTIPGDDFWTAVVEIPRVEQEMLTSVLLHEILRSYPGDPGGVEALRWEDLQGLFPGMPQDRRFFLVLVPVSPVPLRGINALQALVRLQRRRREPVGFLAAGSASGVTVLLPGAGGMPELLHGAAAAAVLANGGSVGWLYQESGASLSVPIAAKVFREGDFPWRMIDNDNPRIAIASAVRRWRNAALAAFAFMAIAGVLAGWRWYALKSDELAGLRGRIKAVSSTIVANQNGKSGMARITKDMEILHARTPVAVYALIATALDHLEARDRVLSLRWDADAQSLALELLSKDPLRVLDGLNTSGRFGEVTSTGIIPSGLETGAFQCTVTCKMGKS